MAFAEVIIIMVIFDSHYIGKAAYVKGFSGNNAIRFFFVAYFCVTMYNINAIVEY